MPQQVSWYGFTLLHMLYTVISLMLVIGVSVLSIQTYTEHRMQAHVPNQAKAFLIDLKRARKSAIGSHRRVILCPRSQPDRQIGCADNPTWAHGWMSIRVGVENRSSPYRYNPQLDIVLSVQSLIEGIEVRSFLQTPYLEYQADGFLNQGSGDLLQICGLDGQSSSRMIHALNQGKVEITKTVICDEE